MDGVVVEQKKAEHVRGDCVDAAVLERQLGFVNICFILTPVFVPCLLININKTISDGGITVDFSIIKVHTSN